MRGRSTSMPTGSAMPAPVRDGRPSTSHPRAGGMGAGGGWGRDGGRRRRSASRCLRPGLNPGCYGRRAFAPQAGWSGASGTSSRAANSGSREETPATLPTRPWPGASPRFGEKRPCRSSGRGVPVLGGCPVAERGAPEISRRACVSSAVKSVPLQWAGCVSIYFFEVPVSGSETLPSAAVVAPRRLAASAENPHPYPAACMRGSAIARAPLERIAS